MVLSNSLNQSALVLGKESEVLDEVQQPRRLAESAQHHFQRDSPRLVLPLDPLPFGESFPVRRQRTHAAVAAVRRNHQRVVPEQRRNSVLQMFVTRQVFIERLPSRHAWLLEFNDDERQSIHETDQIRPASIKITRDRHLTDEQKVVGLRVVPIDYSHPLRLLAAPLPIRNRDFNAVSQRAPKPRGSPQRDSSPTGRVQAHR